MSINNDSLNSGLRELSKSIEESRSLHDRTIVDHIFENRSPLILDAYIHQIMGTLEDFLPNLRDHPSIYLKKKKSLDLGALQHFLAWLLAPQDPEIDKKSFGMGEDYKENRFIYDYLLPKVGTSKRYVNDLPGNGTRDDKEDSNLNKNDKLILAIERGFVEKLNSHIFWFLYHEMSDFLNRKTAKANSIKVKQVLQDYKNKQAIKLAEKDSQLEQKISHLMHDEDLDLISIIDAYDASRKKKFLNFANGPLNKDTQKTNSDLEDRNFRWDYNSTVERGIYHTNHFWPERNILSRCIMILHGINPYSIRQPINNTLDPAQRGAFELQALISNIEAKVARWNALEMHSSGMTMVLKCLKKIIDIFEIYSVIHKQYKLEVSGDIRAVDEYTKDDLITLNQLALITGLNPTTILNESKTLEKQRADHNHRLHNNEYLITASKERIPAQIRREFDSRCYKIESAVKWIKYKDYHKSSNSFKRIPLQLTNHEDDVDYGYLELLA